MQMIAKFRAYSLPGGLLVIKYPPPRCPIKIATDIVRNKKTQPHRKANPVAKRKPPPSSQAIAIRACKWGNGTLSDLSQDSKPVIFPGPTNPSFPNP